MNDNEIQVQPVQTPMDSPLMKEFEAGAISNFFKPVVGIAYRITVKSFALDKRVFNDKITGLPREPVFMIDVAFKTINGVPSTQIFSTSCFHIIRTLKDCLKNGTLTRTEFLLKKTEPTGKSSPWIFEALGATSAQSSMDAGAFV